MVQVEWDESLSVGVQDFDDEHKILIGMINDLHDAVLNHDRTLDLSDVLKSLGDYVKVHFSHEEKLFRELGYPDAETHCLEHATFVGEIDLFWNGLEKGQGTLSMQIIQFLKEWLVNHIQKSDKAYTEFFTKIIAGS